MIQLHYVVKVNRKGQITIPKQIRTQLGIQKGDILEITTENNRIILTPLPRLETGDKQNS